IKTKRHGLGRSEAQGPRRRVLGQHARVDQELDQEPWAAPQQELQARMYWSHGRQLLVEELSARVRSNCRRNLHAQPTEPAKRPCVAAKSKPAVGGPLRSVGVEVDPPDVELGIAAVRLCGRAREVLGHIL